MRTWSWTYTFERYFLLLFSRFWFYYTSIVWETRTTTLLLLGIHALRRFILFLFLLLCEPLGAICYSPFLFLLVYLCCVGLSKNFHGFMISLFLLEWFFVIRLFLTLCEFFPFFRGQFSYLGVYINTILCRDFLLVFMKKVEITWCRCFGLV